VKETCVEVYWNQYSLPGITGNKYSLDKNVTSCCEDSLALSSIPAIASFKSVWYESRSNLLQLRSTVKQGVDELINTFSIDSQFQTTKDEMNFENVGIY
jgi:hypothetical protein